MVLYNCISNLWQCHLYEHFVKQKYSSHLGTTIFSHDGMKKFYRVTKKSNNSYYNLTLSYTDSVKNIKDIVRLSDHCHQTLWFNCKSSKITHFASWTDFEGIHHKYFSSKQANICHCAKNHSCSKIGESKTKCNCDHASLIERHDEIQITEKV